MARFFNESACSFIKSLTSWGPDQETTSKIFYEKIELLTNINHEMKMEIKMKMKMEMEIKKCFGRI